jgi:methyltransferase
VTPPALVAAVVAAIGVQRIVELLYARHTARGLQQRGARLVRDDGYGLIVAVHILWLAGLAVEATFSPKAGIGWWTLVGACAYGAGSALRYWSMAALGGRWSTRVWVLPDADLVRRGPYRWLRHPIYLGVALELAAAPMAFGAWGTAVAISALNAVALRRRIEREEAALGLRPARRPGS